MSGCDRDGAAPRSGGEPAAGPRLLGQGYQGAVYRLETPDGPVIVKRAMGGALARAARAFMLRHERRVYDLLRGVPGVPRCLGLHGDELVLEYIEGVSLREARLASHAREQFFTELLGLIEAIHRAGVAHGDLKRKDNILVGPGGRPYVIDFGTAVAAPPGASWWRRFLFREMRRMDLSAWAKLNARGLATNAGSAARRRFRPTVLERLARIVRQSWRMVTLRRRRRARRSRTR